MTTATSFAAVILALSIIRNCAAVDCNAPFNFLEAKECCRTPTPNLDAYVNECPSARAGGGKPDPCVLDCIFKAGNMLQGEDLNLPNVRIVLNNLFGSNTEFVEAYMMGLEKCQVEVKKKVADFKAKGKSLPPGMSKCNLLPMAYSMCANREVLINCPSPAWTNSQTCETAKEYLANCDLKPPRHGGMRGRGGRAPIA